MQRIFAGLCAGSILALLAGCCNCQTHRAASHRIAAPGEHEPRLEWSNGKTVAAPNGRLTLHGPFDNDVVSVAAAGLTAHDWLEVSLDLQIIRTWDGSVDLTPGGDAEATGPDYWSLSLVDGPVLLYTTFSNLREDVFDEASRYQGYPSLIPGDHFLAQSGATRANTLGYSFTRASTGITYNMDATCHLRFLVPHHKADARLVLAAMNLQEPEDESWAISNLTIRPLRAGEVPRPAEAAIAAAFDDAAKPGSLNGPRALQTLVAGMNDTVKWIDAHVQPRPVSLAAVTPQLQVLTASGEEWRQAASKLADLGPQVEVPARDAYRSAAESGQVHIDNLLQALGVRPIGDDALRRVMLATRVLEIIGTPEALALRRKLTLN